MPSRAIVRSPGELYPQALTRLDPPPLVDLALAREQHAAYTDALRACGLDVIVLPPDPDRPDAVFVQDPVIIANRCAIVARPAAESRRGEADALVEVLKPYMSIVELCAPATLDGGDVLIAGERLYVGLSSRSNRAACHQLAQISGWPAESVPVPDNLLHLLSGCTCLGDDRLLVTASLADAFPQFERVIVPDEETQAANVLIAGGHAIVPAGYPRTTALVRQCGFEVHLVEMSEFEKRDGGVTCSSLLF